MKRTLHPYVVLKNGWVIDVEAVEVYAVAASEVPRMSMRRQIVGHDNNVKTEQ